MLQKYIPLLNDLFMMHLLFLILRGSSLVFLWFLCALFVIVYILVIYYIL